LIQCGFGSEVRIALFDDLARPVKHIRFPTQTPESPHFRASTQTDVKRFFSHRGCPGEQVDPIFRLSPLGGTKEAGPRNSISK